MSEKKKMKFTVEVAASAEAVYRAFTDQDTITQWLCDTAQLTPQEDGVLFLHWTRPNYYAVGEFTKLKPHRKINFTWYGRHEPAPTKVKVRIKEKNGVTRVKLTHKKLGSGEAWARTRRQIESGWSFSLDNLKQVLETGLDRRVYDRPFVGVYIAGQVGEAEMEDLGLEAEGGIRIAGAVPDSAAAEAELEANDIIVAIDDEPVPTFSAWQDAMAPVSIGDTVSLTIWRQDETMSVPLTVGRRPVPEVPADPTLLADQIQVQYEQLIDELDLIVAGTTEDEADYSPDDRWSAKEILAHLLTTERGMHMAIASNMSGTVLSGWPNNPRPWLMAYADTHTLETMAISYRNALEETVSLLAHLPADLVARKATYFYIAQQITGLLGHIRGHFGEMQSMIAEARTAHGHAAALEQEE